MAKIRTTKGATTPLPSSALVPQPSVQTTIQGSASELQVIGITNRQSAELKAIRANLDSDSARGEYMAAARMIGAPAVLSTFRGIFLLLLAQLSEISIAFEGAATKYSWGGFLGTINSPPYSAYFGATQSSDSIVPRGTEPLAPGGGGTAGVWGNVVLGILDIEYSHRFGGSFCVTLTPTEDSGLELRDATKKLAVDLNRWELKFFVRASTTFFNQPPPPYTGANSILALCACEISCTDSEAYELGAGASLIANSPNVTQADVEALVRQAETEAVTRLEKLARFALGWVHQMNVPAFNRVVERVDRIHVSDEFCRFELSTKTPMIAVRLKVGYLFSAEGPLESERELTAKPWITGRTPPLVRFSFRRTKYIGNARGTGWLTMGYVSPADLVDVHELTVFPRWREDDLLSDDEGGAVASVFQIAFDANSVNQRIAAQQPGTIGNDIWALANDPLRDWTSYSFEIRFELLWG